MFTTVTTTITSQIDLNTFSPTHSVEIEASGDGLPEPLIYAAAQGGCKATLLTLRNQGLAVDEQPAYIEVQTEHGRAVVGPFDDREAADEWFHALGVDGSVEGTTVHSPEDAAVSLIAYGERP